MEEETRSLPAYIPTSEDQGGLGSSLLLPAFQAQSGLLLWSPLGSLVRLLCVGVGVGVGLRVGVGE